MRGASIVFVEFVIPGGFFSLPTLPFLKGAMAAADIPVRWLRFGVSASVRARSDAPGIPLPAADLERLLAVCVESRATAVLFSQSPAPEVVAALIGACGARVGAVDPVAGGRPAGPVRPDEAVLLGPSIEELLGWALDPAALPGGVDPFAAPEFGFEEANGIARQCTPLAMLLSGRSCDWTGPLRDSRFFAGKPLETLPDEWGCAFCVGPSAWDGALRGFDRIPFAGLVTRQVEALARTFPASARSPEVRLLGARFGADPVGFARIVAASALRPATFVIESRTDRLPSRIERLRNAGCILASAGHRLQLGIVGVESFAARQLDRFHKGCTPTQNLAALRVLRAVASDPDRPIDLRPDSAFSTILFDPWSTPGEVATTLAVVRRLNLLPLCRKLFGSRLRLHPGLPLAIRAAADGLLIDRYEDPFLDTARRTFYPDELPWKFRDARMESLGRLIVRLSALDEPADDPLTASLAEWRRDEGSSALVLAERLCQAASTSCAETPASLLARARALRPAQIACEWLPAVGGRDVDPLVQHAIEYAQFGAGLKPVMKLEEPRPEGALEARVAREQALWPDALVSAREAGWAGGAAIEVFVGRAPARVENARTIATYLDKSSDSPDRRRAVVAFGRLMGYPTCCARAYADEPHVTTSGFERLRLRRLLEGSGEVPPFFHLFVPYVPCSTTCRATAAWIERLLQSPDARTWLDRWAAAYARDPADDWRSWGRCAVLHLLDRPGQFFLFRVLDSTRDGLTERLTYSPVAAYTADPRRLALLEGDTLEVEEGLVRVLARGIETAEFALDAVVAQGGHVLHAPFWSEWLGVAADPFPGPRAGTSDDPGHPSRAGQVRHRADDLGGDRPRAF